MYSLGWSSPRGNQIEYSRVHMMNPRDHPQQNGKIPSSQSQCITVSCILMHDFQYFIYRMSYQKICNSADPDTYLDCKGHITSYRILFSRLDVFYK